MKPKTTTTPERKGSRRTRVDDNPLPLAQRKSVTVLEASQLLGISLSKAYELIGEGRLRAVNLGKKYVPMSAIRDLLGESDATAPVASEGAGQ